MAYRFDVDPPQPGSEILIAHLAEQGFEAFSQDDNGFDAWIPADRVGDIRLQDLEFPGFTWQWSSQKVERKNWNADWEKNFERVTVDNLLCMRAPFHGADHGCRHEIVIMPKMSFGTGHHQTTRLMCRMIFAMDVKGKHVLDMGCGTGVLGILCAQLGAAKVVAVDTDPWCVENARENCAANGFPDMEVRLGDVKVLEPGERFDVIVANINRNILTQQMAAYARHAQASTALAISGFFTTDTSELESVAASHGFVWLAELFEDGWAAMRFVRKE